MALLEPLLAILPSKIRFELAKSTCDGSVTGVRFPGSPVLYLTAFVMFCKFSEGVQYRSPAYWAIADAAADNAIIGVINVLMAILLLDKYLVMSG